MMTLPSLRRTRYDATPIIVAVIVIAVVVGALLTWQNSQSQQRYSTLRSGQATGQEQRTDQSQLTCVLWAILREQNEGQVTAAMKKAADRICAAVPTPAPSSK